MSYALASFPNSRVMPRAATSTAATSQVIVQALPTGPSLLAPADPNRTYMTIRNISATVGMWYCYQIAGNPVPTAAQFTFPIYAGETASGIESPQAVWGLSMGPGPITAELDIGDG